MIGDDGYMDGGEISLSLLLGLSLSLVFGRFLIPRLEELNVGQQIRPEGPESHKKKSGTPTMGGIIFISAIIVSRVIVYLYKKTVPSKEELLILGLMVSYGLIGFIDDYRKVKLGRSLGLRAREKFALQLLFAVLFLWGVPEMNARVTLPFSGSTWDMGWLYPLFALVLILGTANGMNFTDGLDGLGQDVAGGQRVAGRRAPVGQQNRPVGAAEQARTQHVRRLGRIDHVVTSANTPIEQG